MLWFLRLRHTSNTPSHFLLARKLGPSGEPINLKYSVVLTNVLERLENLEGCRKLADETGQVGESR
jgi:hypothetical protein